MSGEEYTKPQKNALKNFYGILGKIIEVE